MTDRYQALDQALRALRDQITQGKGALRHDPDQRPFDQQDAVRECVEDGLGFARGQVRKKVRETAQIQDYEQRRAEWLGAAAYCLIAWVAEEIREKREHLAEELCTTRPDLRLKGEYRQ